MTEQAVERMEPTSPIDHRVTRSASVCSHAGTEMRGVPETQADAPSAWHESVRTHLKRWFWLRDAVLADQYALAELLSETYALPSVETIRKIDTAVAYALWSISVDPAA